VQTGDDDAQAHCASSRCMCLVGKVAHPHGDVADIAELVIVYGCRWSKEDAGGADGDNDA